MTQYDKLYDLPIIMPPESLDNILANVLAEHHLRNLRVAETEKFAHVTYFFNGGIETPFAGEDRVLIPSLKVATYDLAPEMKAEAIGDAIVKAINDTAFDLIVSNFANADMVGHSGKLEPTIKACEAVDAQLGRIYKAIKEKNGSWLITADHGNAEQMVDLKTGAPHTAHTTNPVPLIYVAEEASHYRLRSDGSLLAHAAGHSQDWRAQADDGRRFARTFGQVNFSALKKGEVIAASPFFCVESHLD
jgi:2,3-bisphosphoglycerate-independent phosphoglycerate mutase